MKANDQKVIALVDAKYAAFALPFAAAQDVRYYLNGILITPSKDGGVIIAATDGHLLFCVRDEAGMADRPVILPLQKKDHAATLKRAAHIRVFENGDFDAINEDKVTTWVSPGKEIEGKFPDIFGLLGDLNGWKDGLVGSLNPAYLHRVMQCAPRANYRGIRFFQQGEKPDSNATLFTLSHPKAFGLVMPMRIGERENGLDAIVPSDFKAAA